MNHPMRIPTILGIILVAALIGGLAVGTQYFIRQPTSAGAGRQPKDVLFTNITDSGFTVTWATDVPTKGIVEVKKDTPNAKSTPFFDERHLPDNIGEYTMHSVPVKGLEADTSYNIFILEHNKGINKDEALRISTAPKKDPEFNTLGPTYGTVLTKDNTPAGGAIVYLTLPDSQTLSTLVKPSGSYLIPLNLIRTRDLSTFLTFPEEPARIEITVKKDGQEAKAITTTKNNMPVPDMILGNTYNFENSQVMKKEKKDETKPLAEKDIDKNILGTQTEEKTVNDSYAASVTDDSTKISTAVSLLTPKMGSFIKSEYPLVSGTGIAESIVTVTIGSTDPQTGTTAVKKDGTWSFTPKKPVGIGKQSVTMTAFDAAKKPIVQTHMFEVLKSGTQVLAAATPSGTLATTPSQTTTPTPTLPVPGTTSPTIMVLIVGIILSGLGIFFLVM